MYAFSPPRSYMGHVTISGRGVKQSTLKISPPLKTFSQLSLCYISICHHRKIIKREALTLANNPRLQSPVLGKAEATIVTRWQGPEAADHTESLVRRQREECGCSTGLFFCSVCGPGPQKDALHSQGEQSYLHQTSQEVFSRTGLDESKSPKSWKLKRFEVAFTVISILLNFNPSVSNWKAHHYQNRKTPFSLAMVPRRVLSPSRLSVPPSPRWTAAGCWMLLPGVVNFCAFSSQKKPSSSLQCPDTGPVFLGSLFFLGYSVVSSRISV